MENGVADSKRQENIGGPLCARRATRSLCRTRPHQKERAATAALGLAPWIALLKANDQADAHHIDVGFADSGVVAHVRIALPLSADA